MWASILVITWLADVIKRGKKDSDKDDVSLLQGICEKCWNVLGQNESYFYLYQFMLAYFSEL